MSAQLWLPVLAVTMKCSLTLLVACAGVVGPSLAAGCDMDTRQKCQEQVGELISYRAEAMARAFGNLPAVIPANIEIKFVGPADAEYGQYANGVGYDRAQRSFIVPRNLVSAKVPNPLRASAYYWPFYQNELYRQMFPIIAAVDSALWSAYLQEAAGARGDTWPHRNCASLHIEKRLPCEMLVAGVTEHLTTVRYPMFNSNRLDRIWPDNFASFERVVWRKDDSRYRDVQRYGGLALVKPLIDEFGVPQALLYFAQTPFLIEDGNVRTSALRYQAAAKEWLAADRQKSRKQMADDG